MNDEKKTDEVATVCTLEMRDDQCSETVEFDHEPDASEIEEACEEWVKGGDWGIEGASISVSWTLTDTDGDEIETGHETVEIEPDHAELIRGCMSRSEFELCCGDDPDSHDWTSEGEGGCTENPGVWSTGGTSMLFASHCRTCGLHRSEHHCGSQRNPGEHDRTTYSMPDAWCAECQSEECECETEGDSDE